MKKIRQLSILLVIITLITSFVPVYAQDSTEQLNGEYAQIILRTALSIVKSNYKYDIKDEELYKNALYQVIKEHPEVWESAFRGIYDNLDQHSAYFSKEEYDAFEQSLSGQICGIGVGVMEFSDGILVTQVYDDSPAMNAGVRSGDIIISANGVDITDMEFELAKSYITGEEGTPVKITLLRNGKIIEKEMVRAKISIESGEYYSIENDTIGYINLYSFDENANEFVRKALSDFDEKKITNIIMDLRNNPGGSLLVLNEVCQHFIPKGPTVYIEYKNPLNNYVLESANAKPKYNVIVLTNSASASASEAFSGAIQDTKVGIVVGSQTYGKGTMQTVTKFKIGGGIKLTQAEYLTPNKRNINGIGIEPDVKVKDSEVKYHDADILPITYQKVLKQGDIGKDVLALKIRLNMLGLNVDCFSEVFDKATMFAVKKFQETQGLAVTGILDMNTQVAIENMFIGKTISDNKVFNTAVEIFKSGKIDYYKNDWSPDDYKNIKR